MVSDESPWPPDGDVEPEHSLTAALFQAVNKVVATRGQKAEKSVFSPPSRKKFNCYSCSGGCA